MNKIPVCIMMMLMLASSVFAASGSVKVNIISGDVYTSANVAPTSVMKLTSGTVNVAGRPSKYAFQGELLHWDVLVSDANGKSDLASVVLGGSTCALGTQLTSGSSLSTYGVSGTFDPNIMAIYSCDLAAGTIHGNVDFSAVATDKAGLTGTSRLDTWMLNPILSVTSDTSLQFGALSPGQVGSKTLTFSNAGEVPVLLSISADQNFYDPTSSGAMCPTTNALATQGDGTSFHTGFWYSATSGSITTGNKRMPFGNTFVQSDPILSSSVSPSWKDTTTGNVYIVPNTVLAVTFKLGLPNPCQGKFTSGGIYVWGSVI
jgi:hypothetical protein